MLCLLSKRCIAEIPLHFTMLDIHKFIYTIKQDKYPNHYTGKCLLRITARLDFDGKFISTYQYSNRKRIFGKQKSIEGHLTFKFLLLYFNEGKKKELIYYCRCLCNHILIIPFILKCLQAFHFKLFLLTMIIICLLVYQYP